MTGQIRHGKKRDEHRGPGIVIAAGVLVLVAVVLAVIGQVIGQ